MNGKSVPALLVGAMLVLAATVLLTTRPPEAPAESSASPPAAVREPSASAVPGPAGTLARGGESALVPAASGSLSESGLPSSAAAAEQADRSAASPGSRPGGGATSAEDVAGAVNRAAAEAAVAHALAAAGLSSAGLTVTSAAPASAANTTEPGQPDVATPADGPSVPPGRDLEIAVPTGARVPVVFYDQQPRPAAQQAFLDRIAAEFSEVVSSPPAGYSQQEVWEAARKIADERYTVLYGFDAFNQISMQAAKEALKDKKAASAQTAPP